MTVICVVCTNEITCLCPYQSGQSVTERHCYQTSNYPKTIFNVHHEIVHVCSLLCHQSFNLTNQSDEYYYDLRIYLGGGVWSTIPSQEKITEYQNITS